MKKTLCIFFLIMLVACAPAPTPTPTATPTPCPPCPIPTPAATPTPDPTLGSLYNPLKLEQEGMVYDAENQAWLTVSITEAVRGDEAWEIIQDADISNVPPPPGMEYLLAHIRAKYVEGPRDQSYEIDVFDFKYLDARVRLLGIADKVTGPEPRLGDVPPRYEGDIMEGSLAFVIPEGDDNLMVAFGLDRLVEPVWFRLSFCGWYPVC